MDASVAFPSLSRLRGVEAGDLLVRQSSSGASNGASQASALAAISEPGSATNIPTEELTPKVKVALAQMQAQIDGLRADRARLSQKLREAEELADSDTLVPVFNRRAFVRELTRVMSFAQRYDVQASLVYFDLDGFKQVNDRFGHPAGDAILKAVGQVLLTHIRESDLAGRVGGDEFAVILAKAGPSDALAKGAQLAQAIRDTSINYLGHNLAVGAAFGAYTFEPGDTAERALSRADEAMYAHKAGRKVQSL
jgi:diguanylate cyclase (GGDEF)-like protein